MSQIPENEVTQADINEWYRLQQELSRVKSAEALLRSKLYNHFFKNPVEGTNTVPLSEGWVMKAKRVINRAVDEGSLMAYAKADENGVSELSKMGINPQKLIKWKPELAVKEYRELTEEQRMVFDNVLVIKDGSPALEIVLPKRAAKTE